jgi:hypothetical protein
VGQVEEELKDIAEQGGKTERREPWQVRWETKSAMVVVAIKV